MLLPLQSGLHWTVSHGTLPSVHKASYPLEGYIPVNQARLDHVVSYRIAFSRIIPPRSTGEAKDVPLPDHTPH